MKLRKASSEEDKQIVRLKISEQLARNGGLAMKVGQVVANYKKDPAFQQLLKGIPQRKFSEMKKQFASGEDHPNLGDYEFIDEKARAASLGQVHKAKLKTGEVVAVKIQYPEMRKTIDAELKLAGLVPMMGPAKKWQIDLNSYKRVLIKDLKSELDYRNEAQKQQQFLEGLADIEGLIIPKVYPEYSSDRVLTQSWEEGVFFDEVVNWDKKDRIMVARTLLMALWKSMFVLGEVHTDPHLGNYFFNKKEGEKPTVTLLDFGSTITVSESERMALLKLILATREKIDLNYMQCFAAMGFDLPKLSYIEHELPMICPVLFKPFLTNTSFNVDDWKVTRGFEVILGDRKWWFRSSGSADLYLLMRSFQGVMLQLKDLDVQLPWWGIMSKALGEEVLQKARDYELPPTPAYEKKEPVRAISKVLRVIMTEGEKELMSLNFPPDAALDLEELMPESALEEMYAAGWKMEDLREQLLETQLAPMVIFESETDGKAHKVWLE